MKLKISVLMILLALQGCSSFDEKFSSEKFMTENVDII
ncbi:putative lipoprotein, partial [Escherichia coli P0298942.8]